MRRQLFLLALFCSIPGSSAWCSEVFLYRNTKNTELLNLVEARRIFDSRRLEWQAGKSIVLLLPDLRKIDEQQFEAFSEISRSRYISLWRAKFFSGRARMPIQFSNEAEALRLVRENAEAIYFSFKAVGPSDLTEEIKEDKLTY